MLLRTLRFDLIAEQPLRYLLNFCRLLHCSHAVSKLAVCLACPLVDRPHTCLLRIHIYVGLLAWQPQRFCLAELMVILSEPQLYSCHAAAC